MIITRMIRIKKQYYNKLFKKGKLLVKILDFLDKNHCQKSMKEF